MAEKIGSIIDGLGVEATLEEGDLVAGVVVISKVIELDGTVRMGVYWSEGMAWTERLGLLTAAQYFDMDEMTGSEDDG